MIKTRIIKVKSIENKEIMIIVITMTKIIITTIIMKMITIIMETMRIKIGNPLKI